MRLDNGQLVCKPNSHFATEGGRTAIELIKIMGVGNALFVDVLVNLGLNLFEPRLWTEIPRHPDLATMFLWRMRELDPFRIGNRKDACHKK